MPFTAWKHEERNRHKDYLVWLVGNMSWPRIMYSMETIKKSNDNLHQDVLLVGKQSKAG